MPIERHERQTRDLDEDEEQYAIRQRRRPLSKTLAYVVLLLLGIIYIINPGAGIIEVIPDNLPIIGNLDEAGVASLMVLIFQKLKAKEY